MIKSFVISGFLWSLVLFFPTLVNAETKSDVLGLQLGMNK